MPITVICDCGKHLKAPDALAGKRAKCPACGKTLAVPAPAAPAEESLIELADIEDLRLPDFATVGTIELADEGLAPPAAPAARTPPAGPAGQINTSFQATAASMARRRAPRAAEERGPKAVLSIAGHNITRPRLAGIVAVLILLIGGVVYYFTVLGKDVRIIGYQTVDATLVMNTLDHLPSGQPTLGPDNPLQFTVGNAGEGLYVTRPDPDGRFILVHLQVSRSALADAGLEGRYTLLFSSDAYALDDGSGTPIKPVQLAEAFSSAIPLNLAGSGGYDYHTLLPAGATPDKTADLKPGDGGTASGTLEYDGADGVTGSLRFKSKYYSSGNSPSISGFTATGKLEQKLPTGQTVAYDYKGPTADVTWDASSTGWWSISLHQRPAGLSPFTKFDVYLLFPKPQTPGAAMALSFHNKTIGALATADARSSAASGVAIAPGGAASAAAGNTPTVGGQNKGPAAAPSPNNPMAYFTGLANARKMGMETVASSNLQQIGYAIMMYTNQNGGQFPDNLEQLRGVMPDIDGLLVNPRTHENPGFIYVKPARTLAEIANPAAAPMVYETKDGKIDKGGSTLYVDMHIDVKIFNR